MVIKMEIDNYKAINKIIDESTISSFVSLLNSLFGDARIKFGDKKIKKELLKGHVHLFEFMNFKPEKGNNI